MDVESWENSFEQRTTRFVGCVGARCSGKGRSLIEGHVRERILDDARRRRRGSTLFPQVTTQVRRYGGHTTFIFSRGSLIYNWKPIDDLLLT